MKPVRIIVCYFCTLLISPGLQSQIPNGTWRDHLPYSQGNRLAEYGNRIFCATSGGGLFSYNTSDHSVRKYSKVNGLSDADITAIGYEKQTRTLVIGYMNGNIDLISGDSIINIPDIKRKTISGEKSVNNIFFKDQFAYLACGFGIVLCDLARREIKDSYIFGPGGSQLKVNDIAFDGERLYAATARGIYSANVHDPNLVDFNAWSRLVDLPDPLSEYHYLAWFNDRLFTVYQNPSTGFDEIITISDSGWQVWANSYNDSFGYLGEQQGCLVLSSLLRSKVYDQSEQLIRDVLTYYARYVLYDTKKQLWYADPSSGMVKLDESGAGQVIQPNGPAYRDAGDIDLCNCRFRAGWVGRGKHRQCLKSGRT